jgi:dTDP-4-dehydrorhamnose reductase
MDISFSPILVLGDGLLGSEICKQTGWDNLSRRKDGFDIFNIEMYPKIFKQYKTIINCIANTDTYSIDRDSHWNVNYKFVYDLANYCNEFDVKLVQIGTDYFYANNKNIEPSENDVPVHSENWYSYTKLLGDGIVQLLSNDYLICRCTHKPYPFPFPKAYIDRIGNFDYTHKIAELIISLVKENANGVFNVGTEKKSIYDLVKRDFPNVIPIYTPDEYPKNTSMNIDKMISFLNK